MNKSTSTRLGQILLDKGLVTAEQLDIAIKEQQKRRQLLDPFDENLGVNSSLGEILIEMGFIDRLQLKRGLNWQLMLRKMAIVMSFCAPLMTVSYGAAAGTSTTLRPTFTANASSSSSAPKTTPGFTFTKSSSASSVPVQDEDFESSSSIESTPKSANSSSSSSAISISSRSSSNKSSVSSSKASSAVSSVSKSSAPSESVSTVDTTAPKMPEKVSVVAALYDQVQLSWSEASDALGVTHYKIYRDQVQIDTIDGYQTEYVDFNIAPGKTYLYGVSAGDEAGNWSVIKSVFAQTAATPTASSGAQSSSAKSSSASLAANSSSKASVTSSSSSSKASLVSSSSSSKAASSIASSSSSKAASSAASSAGASVAGPVSFNWTAPTLRENGNSLDITEVGGYELRYRKVTDTNFTYVTINDAWKNYHNFTWLEGTYVFQIAAFDKNGLYSTFVDLNPH